MPIANRQGFARKVDLLLSAALFQTMRVFGSSLPYEISGTAVNSPLKLER